MHNNAASRQAFILFVFLLAWDTQSLMRGASRRDPTARETVQRQAMESLELLAERRQCVPFTDVSLSVKNSANIAPACIANGCAGETSCCRVLVDSLVCDTNNDFPFFACVCNEFTRTHRPTSPPVPKEPTTAPSRLPSNQETEPPAGAPTKTPTIGQNASGGKEPTVPLSSLSPNSSPTKEPTNSDGVSQVSQQNDEEKRRDEEKYIHIILGSAAAGSVLMIVGFIVLVRKRNNHQSEGPQPSEFATKGADLDEMEEMDEHAVESASSQDENHREAETSFANPATCCEDEMDGVGDTCHGFSSWLGSTLSPQRVRTSETNDTVQF